MTPSIRTADRIAIAASVAFVAMIALANWLTTKYGIVAVGFGLSATAGTFAAGATFTLRDEVQDRSSYRKVVALILVGAGVSWLVADPMIAKASLAAFAISEVADLVVYSPLRRRNWSAAVWLSALVGSAVDSVAFLHIAFGSSAVSGSAVVGQIIGKGWATLSVWLLLIAVRRRWPRGER